MTNIAGTPFECLRFLDAEGKPIRPLPDFASDPAALEPLYRAMVATRLFDTKAIALQRTGQLGTFASSLGQEAVGVGIGAAMTVDDVLLPSYRDHAAQLLRGVSMVESLLYWSGDERGSDFATARRDFPNCVPIASQVCHGAGVAYAMKLRREPRVAVCILGDGGTSKGDFYEGMNLVGAWTLPLVLVVNNNQWAISVPRSAQTAAPTLAQKALAVGVEGLQVDGNDVVAVRHAVGTALEKARNGGGPTLIEALTYRLGDHTTADDATRYRDAEAVSRQWALEPILRLRNYLVGQNCWNEEREQQLIRECTEQVNRAVADYLAVAAPSVEQMFDRLYATLPQALEGQRNDARHFAASSGGDHG
ncbi:MAG: pyruvate dehydrogenase (acetyl-transferring) E1 component subunit alpha [Rhodocyclaceae bacterium]|nr:pyruvate dehydrogenase (acetyl-transferring) E1 component subunit alpha [Rhodocyclaceae bacterium]